MIVCTSIMLSALWHFTRQEKSYFRCNWSYKLSWYQNLEAISDDLFWRVGFMPFLRKVWPERRILQLEFELDSKIPFFICPTQRLNDNFVRHEFVLKVIFNRTDFLLYYGDKYEMIIWIIHSLPPKQKHQHNDRSVTKGVERVLGSSNVH